MIESFKLIEKEAIKSSLQVPIYLVDSSKQLHVIVYDYLHSSYRLVNLCSGKTQQTMVNLNELYEDSIENNSFVRVKLDITATEI